MNRIFVGKKSEFKSGERKVVVAQGREIGVFRFDDDFYAWENICPHAGGPVCQGKIVKRVEEVIAADKTSLGFRFSENQTNIVCPWHGYEYDARTGCHQGDPDTRLIPCAVKVVQDDVFLVMNAE
jgi:nitrite reductase/ring-hydroxylating ferredoxin subunit